MALRDIIYIQEDFYLIKDGDGNIIDPMYLLNNIDKFQYVNDGSISPTNRQFRRQHETR